MRMRHLLAGGLGLLAIVLPVSLGAWGMDVHQAITRRALDGLPADLKPFFDVNQPFVVQHSIDPDLWRIVGLRGELGDEPMNHFFDIDSLGEPAPFTNVPHDRVALIAKYGTERAEKAGRLPWRTAEIFDKLVAAYQDAAQHPTGYGANDARYLAAILSHYVEDAHVPFHAVVNYDGDLTHQHGIHSRFENDVILRHAKVLRLQPVTVKPIPSIREFVFQTLVTSQSLVDTVLKADRDATRGRDVYDDGYFEAFWVGTRPIIEQRLSDAASGAASAIVAAWERAGKPKLPVGLSTTPQRIPR